MLFPIILLAAIIFPGCSRDSAPAAGQTQSTTNATNSAVSDADIERSLEAADAYFSSASYDEAEAILQVLARKIPGESRAHEALGLVHLARAHQARQRGDTNTWRLQATAAYERFLRAISCITNDDNAGLHQSAGEIAHTLSKTSEALAHYLRAAAIDPANPKHTLYAAQVHLGRAQWDQARLQLLRTIEIDPDEPYAWASLARAELGLGNVPGALEHIRRAQFLGSDDLAIRVQHASILRSAGRPREALELLVGLSPPQRTEEFVAAELAECYLAIERPQDAARVWQSCFESSMNGPRAWHAAAQAGRCLLAAGQREQAWTWLQLARRTAPDEPEVRELEAAMSR